MADDPWESLVRSEAGQPDVREGTMFGAPCLKAGSKVYATAMDETVVFKLSADRVAALIEDGSGEAFEPMGRAMKEWVAVRDPARWPALAAEARRFVAGG